MKVHAQTPQQAPASPGTVPDCQPTLTAITRAMNRLRYEYRDGVADRDMNSYVRASAAGQDHLGAVAREAIDEWAAPVLEAFRDGQRLGTAAPKELQTTLTAASDLVGFLSLILAPGSAIQLRGSSETDQRGIMLSFHRLMDQALSAHSPTTVTEATNTSPLIDAPPLPKRDFLAEARRAVLAACGEEHADQATAILNRMPDRGSRLINVWYRADYLSALKGSLQAYGWGDPEHYQSVETIREYNRRMAAEAVSQKAAAASDPELISGLRELGGDPFIGAAILTKAFTKGKYLVVSQQLPVQAVIAVVTSKIGGEHRASDVKDTLIALTRSQLLYEQRYRGDLYYALAPLSPATKSEVRRVFLRARALAAELSS